jgi:hypothetical protein
MIERRAKVAGVEAAIGCHGFMETAVPNCVKNNGTLKKGLAGGRPPFAEDDKARRPVGRPNHL